MCDKDYFHYFSTPFFCKHEQNYDSICFYFIFYIMILYFLIDLFVFLLYCIRIKKYNIKYFILYVASVLTAILLQFRYPSFKLIFSTYVDQLIFIHFHSSGPIKKFLLRFTHGFGAITILS